MTLLVECRLESLLTLQPIQPSSHTEYQIDKLWGKTGDPKFWNLVRNLSRRQNSEIRKERNRQLNNDLGKDTKSFWKTVNNLMGKKVCAESGFMVNGRLVDDPQAVSDGFASFFQNKVNSLATPVRDGVVGISEGEIKF